MIIGLFATRFILHESMAKAGMGLLFPIYAIPIITLAFVVWALICNRFSDGLRRATMVVTILIACSVWALFRYGGITGGGEPDFSWRWAETIEENLLDQAGDETLMLPTDTAITEIEVKWPGFRGPNRDGIIHDVQIETDWSASPPVEMWRRPVGPGWSSFAVSGNLIYTQEQRGDDEVVACYKLTTGEPLWRHQDAVRFWEAQGGAGPRGTPTLSDGRIYALGATGILNVLNASNGSVVWSRNVGIETNAEVPTWAFSSSPLIADDKVIIAAAGTLIAYELDTGDLHWSKPYEGDCYSSPHLLNIDGVDQVLFQNKVGTISVLPSDGTLLWEYSWPGHPIVQPAQIADGDILVSADERSGVRRISVANGPDGWTVEERWTSTQIKPYFNDSVVHNGHVYGFDGPKLACLDIEDGTRKWKGGRYGRGQFVLLADQDLLLVLSEKGELALVEAVPDQFTELARFPAIEGKTWNHPVLVEDILLVRNGQEMAAFRLSLK
ncbi:PQQ-binding-like beta-propeller repeat protein [candidate division KSB1 bacterium]|nr:PQQ-binding-like beta-propeller repeat protein [candidate division KSB1 bacterium]